MNPLDPLSRAMEILRKRISADTTERQRGVSRLPVLTTSEERALPEHTDLESLKRRVIEATAEIDRESKDYDRKAMRILVENVLVYQFQSQITRDPAFYTLVDEITAVMLREKAVTDDLAALMKSQTKET